MAVKFSGGPHWPVEAQVDCEVYRPPPLDQPPHPVSLYSFDYIASENHHYDSNTVITPKLSVGNTIEELSKPKLRSSFFSLASTTSKLSSTYTETNPSRTETGGGISSDRNTPNQTPAATKLPLRFNTSSVTSSRSSSFRSVKSFRTLQSLKRDQDPVDRLPSFLGRHRAEEETHTLSHSFSFASSRELHSTAWNSTRYRSFSLGKPSIPTRTASLSSIQEANTSRRLESRSLSISSAQELNDLLSVNKEPLFVGLAKRANRDFVFPTRPASYTQGVSPLPCRARKTSSYDTLRRSNSSIGNAERATPLIYKSRSSASLHNRRTREPVFVPKSIYKTRTTMSNMNPLSVGDATVDEEGRFSIAEHGHQAEGTNGTTGAEHGGSGEQEPVAASDHEHATAPDAIAPNATAPDATVPDATVPDTTAHDATQTRYDVQNTVAGRNNSEQEKLITPHNFPDSETTTNVDIGVGASSELGVVDPHVSTNDEQWNLLSQADRDYIRWKYSHPDSPFAMGPRPWTSAQAMIKANEYTAADKDKGKAPEAAGMKGHATTAPDKNGTTTKVEESRSNSSIARSESLGVHPAFRQPFSAENAASADAGVATPTPVINRNRKPFASVKKHFRAFKVRAQAFRRRATSADTTVGVEAFAEDGTSNASTNPQDAGEGQTSQISTDSGAGVSDGNRLSNTSADRQEFGAGPPSSNITGSSAGASNHNPNSETIALVSGKAPTGRRQSFRNTLRRGFASVRKSTAAR